jgi:hypothetical protein
MKVIASNKIIPKIIAPRTLYTSKKVLIEFSVDLSCSVSHLYDLLGEQTRMIYETLLCEVNELLDQLKHN